MDPAGTAGVAGEPGKKAAAGAPGAGVHMGRNSGGGTAVGGMPPAASFGRGARGGPTAPTMGDAPTDAGTGTGVLPRIGEKNMLAGDARWGDALMPAGSGVADAPAAAAAAAVAAAAATVAAAAAPEEWSG